MRVGIAAWGQIVYLIGDFLAARAPACASLLHKAMNDSSLPTATLIETADAPASSSASTDFPIGQPLPFALVEPDGKPLLPAGMVLPDAVSRDFLLAHFKVCAAPEVLTNAGEPAQPTSPEVTSKPSLSLADMNIKIGTSLRIRTPSQSGYGVVLSYVIGVAPNQSLFVTRPLKQNHDVQLMFGERLEIFHMEQRSVFDFVCTVTTVCKTPFDFLVLSPPAQIRRLRNRNAPRMELTRPVLYRTDAIEQPMSPASCTGIGAMLDLSARGMSLLTPGALGDVGTRLRVSFQLSAQGELLDVDVPATVRNLRPQRRTTPGGDGEMIYGLEFEALDHHAQLVLRCLALEQSAG